MKRAVMASLRHGFSTDDKPQHDLCPHGAASWSFYQPPGPHAKLVHTPLNFKKLNPPLEPVYQRLTKDQLLQRCVSGKTQNSNECLHSSVWVRCPKDKFACKNRVRFAVVTGAREFNFEPAAALNTAQFYGFTTGCNMKRLNKARSVKGFLAASGSRKIS